MAYYDNPLIYSHYGSTQFLSGLAKNGLKPLMSIKNTYSLLTGINASMSAAFV